MVRLLTSEYQLGRPTWTSNHILLPSVTNLAAAVHTWGKSWPAGWVFSLWFVLLCFSTILYLYRKDPALLAERYRQGRNT